MVSIYVGIFQKVNLNLRKSSFIEAISWPDGSESMFPYPLLQCFTYTAP